MLHTVTTWCKENQALTALFLFIILLFDTLYIYRTLKRVKKKSSARPADRHSSENNHPNRG